MRPAQSEARQVKFEPLEYPPERTLSSERYIAEEIHNSLGFFRNNPDKILNERELVSLSDRSWREEIYNNTQDMLSQYLSCCDDDDSVFLRRAPAKEVCNFLLSIENLSLDGIKVAAGLCAEVPRQEFRAGPQFTIADDFGRMAEFIDSEKVGFAIEQIIKAFNYDNCLMQPVFRATWIMVATLNAHAFANGNGRLARALANAVLIRSGSLGRTPLPLGPLMYATRGNFKIAANRAVLQGRWMPALAAMRAMVAGFLSIVNKSAKDT